jgi:hypothetical protein
MVLVMGLTSERETDVSQSDTTQDTPGEADNLHA